MADRDLADLVAASIDVARSAPLGRQRALAVSPREFAIIATADPAAVQQLAAELMGPDRISGWSGLPNVRLEVFWP